MTPLDLPLAETAVVIEGADGQFYNSDEFWEAVRRELQRLVTPQ